MCRLIASLGPVSGELQGILQSFLESRGATADEAAAFVQSASSGNAQLKASKGHLQRPDKPVYVEQCSKLAATHLVMTACKA